jgi:DNA-binding response OmpR family regulator
LIEDEEMLGRIITDSLEVSGFTMLYAADGHTGWELFKKERPDIIVMDVMMPGMDGFSLTQKIRQENNHTPVIFLTARSQTADVIKGFELGGNDYLKKPFSMDELVVRIKSLLNRQKGFTGGEDRQPEVVSIGYYIFNYTKQVLTCNNHSQFLSHREAEILKRLYEHRNHVLERKVVLQELWGDDNFFNGRSMDVFITRLRRYLKEDPNVQIVNVRGVGYKLIC